ncbi:hypothetical protein ABXI34_002444 [Salmonella enterica]|nr:Uncharacterised protein [Salmonella enterica subsp. arizonae]
MQHEQSLADMFRDFMREQSHAAGCRFHAFSLDGQDRDTGADYVLTDADRFAIVEFKYTDKNLVSEKYKPKRLTLCQKLLTREDMTRYHDKCHFISWADSKSNQIKTNIYRKEICNITVFGCKCGLPDLNPVHSEQISALAFAQDFFNIQGLRSLSLPEFEAYLAWVLTETSASTNSTLELLARNPNTQELMIMRLNSLSDAQKWVKDHIKPPSPRKHMGMGY